MNYRSTRKTTPAVLASKAFKLGIAQDGGLFVPNAWPEIPIDKDWKGGEFADFAHTLLDFFIAEDPLQSDLPGVCKSAFDFPIPLIPWNADTRILELFHGPTNSFKDFGARFLAQCLATMDKEYTKPPIVLVATSGDTGSAVAAAFSQSTAFPVVVLFPKGRVSGRQEKQLTVWGDRVFAVAVKGDFDDCQRIVKEAFASAKWRRKVSPVSANSINLGRLIPQMAYFACASLTFRNQLGVVPGIVVPSGNAGNATAALWAMKLGFPIRKVIFAHNANHTIPDFFASGVWTPRPTVPTLANAMDVGAPSNFERVLDLFPDVRRLRQVAAAVSVSDAQITHTIKEEARAGRIFCPHTATAVFVRKIQSDPHWILAATAHPAKFEAVIEPLIERPVEIPDSLAVLLDKPSRQFEVEASLADLEAFCEAQGLITF